MLHYVFGQGKAGQTYVYEKDGRYFESRVSYYQELHGLDLTVGAQNMAPATSQARSKCFTTSTGSHSPFGLLNPGRPTVAEVTATPTKATAAMEVGSPSA